jgi:7-carboxy-7-deazaguanine synthase
VTYLVKEIFYTVQGEGAHSGRPAVFVRFAGCNLWSGREEDRATARCQFCDTDFVGTDGDGGGRFATATDLVAAALAHWPVADAREARPFVVCTGGEPLLQLDAPAIEEFRRVGFEIAVETNGTVDVPDGLHWLCVSPKAGNALKVTSGSELKLVYPQSNLQPDEVADMAFDHFFLQPMDGPDAEANTAAALAYCMEHPHWKLSLQTHKLLGVP